MRFLKKLYCLLDCHRYTPWEEFDRYNTALGPPVIWESCTCLRCGATQYRKATPAPHLQRLARLRRERMAHYPGQGRE